MEGGGWSAYTLHPTPYTLQPTPYTLHPTPALARRARRFIPHGAVVHEPERVVYMVSQEKSFNLKLSGNEVYRTHALLLQINIMLCSQLHYQRV